MPKQIRQKQERVIEAVRHGLEGDAAVEFIHRSGFAITQAGIARHLRNMGGRAHIQRLIAEGKKNYEIMESCFPDDDLSYLPREAPAQTELFVDISRHAPDAELLEHEEHPLYETVKMTVRVPADVYEALRLAARAERISQNDLVVEILTRSLSQLPAREARES